MLVSLTGATDRYDPELYAAVHRGTSGDTQFYAQLAEGREAVLELGCGYGRLIPVFMASGARYVGLDIHQGMLRLSRRQFYRPTTRFLHRHEPLLVRGDMSRFAFATKFDLIVLPYSGLYCLPNVPAVSACFEAVRAHLAPGGRFVIDAYNADGFHMDASPEDQPADQEDWVDRVTTHGDAFDVYERSRWNRASQHLATCYRYQPLAGGESRWGYIDHHYLLRAQLGRLLRAARLQMTDCLGDFHGARWSLDSDHLVVAAKPA